MKNRTSDEIYRIKRVSFFVFFIVKLKMKYFIIMAFLLVNPILSAHYRGSMITWRIVNSTSTTVRVELLQRHTWHYYTAMCNDTQIAAGNQKIGSGNLVCWNSCPSGFTNLASVAVPCTAYNLPENYTSGEGRVQISLPVNWTITGVFIGAAWFTLVQGGGNWSVAVVINTYRRSNGKYNQAPIVTMLPIIRLRRNLTYNIRINVADNDFDPYKCLWSTSFIECSGVCMAVPNTTVLNSTSCMLKFTPPKVGYYAIALTIVDYETTTSTTELSRIPIEFLFKVWDANNSCSLPPLYLGDVPADQCIYVTPGQVLTMRIIIKIQCPNATLDNIIGVYLVGFTRSSTYLDPYDSSVNVFMISYAALVEQLGQNLFCFAGVDSIGNQADTTCLRFTVQQGSSSMNTLYIYNATRFPTGSVSKYQSIWTLIYPNGTTYSRPKTEASIRFKYTSSQVDFLVINVVTATNVAYQSDRLIITTSITFAPGTSFYISFDPGVFLEISTCLRDSMGITDPYFWTFQIPSEASTTTTTAPTTTTTPTTTLRSRTVTPFSFICYY
jgi:hypothetical protein